MAKVKETQEAKETTKKETTAIRILCNPTGAYNLANSYGDIVTLSPDLTKRMLEAGDAEIVK